MKTFVRVFIILGAIGAMALVALPALAGVGPPAEDALCLSVCAEEFGLCKSDCVKGSPVPVCNEACTIAHADCVMACAVCPNGIVERPIEQCEPPGSLCSPLRICDNNCRCTIPVGG